MADAERRLGVALLASLRSLYQAADGVFKADDEWWVVWPVSRLVDDNVRAWRDGALDDSLIAFGDDGTGDPFCVWHGDGSHVARWSFIDAEVVAELTMADFERDWLKP